MKTKFVYLSILLAFSLGGVNAAVPHCQSVVIGSGVAGMKAAMDLKDGGNKVCLIEKMPFPGGATNLAATYFVAVGTKEQKAAGKFISVDDYIARQKKMLPNVDVDKLKAQMLCSQKNLDYLNSLGANITRVLSDYQIGTADGTSLGSSIVKVMFKALKEKGVAFYPNTKALDLVLKSGVVTGVKVRSGNEEFVIPTKNVILATGGFAHNQKLVKKFAPEWAGLPTTTAVGSTGDGLEMAVEYGAKTAYTDVVRMNPSVHSENGVNSSLGAARAEGGIMVNLDGKRFCNDYYPDYTQLSRWLQKQKGSIAYIVIDNKAMKASKRLQGFKDKGYFLQADTLAELAKKMGVPPKALEETAKRYSEFVKNGKDLDFGRQHNLTLDFSQPPYYAVKTQPGIQVTLGGIDVNNNMQVIKKDGGFFPNLYAAGEVTYDGSFRPGPTAVGLYQGHIAAQNILRKSN